MADTTRTAVVVPIKLEKHPNAEKLSVVHVFGSTVVVNTEVWTGQDKAVFVPPENFVDCSRPEFASFGTGIFKIKTIKLRGVTSHGILVQCKPEWVIGQDVTTELGIVHDDNDKDDKGCNEGNPPRTVVTKYDIESFYKQHEYFVGKEVVVTEKLHGSQVRVSFDDKGLHVGSRNMWLKENDNVYWKSIDRNLGVERYCRDNPNDVVFGEVIGVQGQYKYKYSPKMPKMLVFDIFRNGKFLDHAELVNAAKQYYIDMVPILFVGQFDLQKCHELSCGISTLDNIGREGVVIKTTKEEKNPRFERMVMKIIGPDYKG